MSTAVTDQERRQVAVVGAGLMGSGIAQVAAVAGWDVVLHDVTDESLVRGRASIEQSTGKLAQKDRMTEEERARTLERITTTTDLAAVSTASVVVEAVFEQVEVKQRVFSELDRLCADDAVLATNTSAIPITSIASVTLRPESVVGTHFFSPVPVMALCELVRSEEHTSELQSRGQPVCRLLRA